MHSKDLVELTKLQDVLLHDTKLQTSLLAAGFHPTDAAAVMAARAADRTGTGAVRVDLRGEATFWLNDLERDSLYRYARVTAQSSCSCTRGLVASMPHAALRYISGVSPALQFVTGK
jgi:hypothetical protein